MSSYLLVLLRLLISHFWMCRPSEFWNCKSHPFPGASFFAVFCEGFFNSHFAYINRLIVLSPMREIFIKWSNIFTNVLFVVRLDFRWVLVQSIEQIHTTMACITLRVSVRKPKKSMYLVYTFPPSSWSPPLQNSEKEKELLRRLHHRKWRIYSICLFIKATMDSWISLFERTNRGTSDTKGY